MENLSEAYHPKFILQRNNLIKEKLNWSLINQRFFNYDFEYTNIPDFFLMTNFRLTKLAVEEINTLTQFPTTNM